MKIKLLLLCFTLSLNSLWAQDNAVKLKDLAVPNSPAFILVDAAPSTVQTPSVPKEFILGLAQSFQEGGGAFPQNYSAEFTPYWWFKPGRSVYDILGLTTAKDATGKTTVKGQNAFAGLKFTNVSVAFLNKDLIPDVPKVNQKILSVGLRTTLVKIHLKNYSVDLAKKVDEWHTAAQEELLSNSDLQDELARHPEKQQEIMNKFKPIKTNEIVKEIAAIIAQKPVFSWDIAAAYATYGINDSIWRTGRSGLWTTISSYLPLDMGSQRNTKNYLNLNFVFRYLFDNYQKSKTGTIVSNNSIDIGGKVALEFERLSIAVESLHRHNNNSNVSSQNRTVGIINYKVADNIYITGSWGKNFDVPDKLITLFGVKWGFGTETVTLPK
jgi:hypothetical protein